MLLLMKNKQKNIALFNVWPDRSPPFAAQHFKLLQQALSEALIVVWEQLGDAVMTSDCPKTANSANIW